MTTGRELVAPVRKITTATKPQASAAPAPRFTHRHRGVEGVISYFTAGSSTSTLAMAIYGMTKRRITPEINAVSTLLYRLTPVTMSAFIMGMLLTTSSASRFRRDRL